MVEQPEPDTKDWTWVLGEACPECGFDTRSPDRAELSAIIREVADRWAGAMAEHSAPTERPRPAVWSPSEYTCHVRDVYDLACMRVERMLTEDDPLYANWDPDAAAIEDDYYHQDPAVATEQMVRAAEAFAADLEAVPDDAWSRPGRRGDGSSFTVESFARYIVHDPVHHLTDITGERWN